VSSSPAVSAPRFALQRVRALGIGTGLLLLALTPFAGADESAAILADRSAGARAAAKRGAAQARFAKASKARLLSIAERLGRPRAATRFRALSDIRLGGARFVPPLIAGLESPNGYLVRYSIVALSELKNRAATPALLKLFADPRTTPADRFYALAAAACAPLPEQSPRLWTVALGDPVERIRRAAEVALIRLHQEALPGLLAPRCAGEGPQAEQARGFLARLFARQGRQAPGPKALFDWVKSEPAKGLFEAPLVRSIDGDGYLCLTDIEDEAEVRRLGMRVVRFRRALSRWLRPGIRREWTSRLRLFARRRDFDDYGATHEFNFIFFEEFYYSALLREIVSFKVPSPALMQRRLQHETAHDVLESQGIQAPPWLGEGICELFEVSTLKDGSVGRPPLNHQWVRVAQTELKAGRLPSLSALVSLDSKSFYGGASRANYAAAWSFLHFLVRRQGRSGAGVVRRIISSLLAGDKDPAGRVLRASNAPGVLEPLWHRHIRSLR